MIEDGSIANYVAIRDAALKALPLVTCRLCEDTGIRSDAIGRKYGFATQEIDEPGHPRRGETGTCNGCHGRGVEPAWETLNHLDVNDVREFAVCLRDCGGFEIC